MNKKGFTLVELIAVIAILGMLSILITPAVLKIRKDVLQNSLKSKISMIDTAAKDYASDNLMEIPSHVKDTSGNCINNTGLTNKYEYGVNQNCYEDCKIILVKSLISTGYLVGEKEDKTILLNPFTNKSLNNEEICIRFDNNNAMKRKIVTYVVGESAILHENE